MTTIVALAVLLSTLMHACWNALVKGGDSPGWQEIAAILVLVAGVETLTFEPGKFATADVKAVVFAALTVTFLLGERLGRRRIPAAILVADRAGAIKFAA